MIKERQEEIAEERHRHAVAIAACMVHISDAMIIS